MNTSERMHAASLLLRDAFGNPSPTDGAAPVNALSASINALCKDLAEMLISKNTDYSSRNIAESPGGALNGLNVRLWDKGCRLRNLIETGAEPQHESLRDTLIDTAGYAILGVLVLDGKWPGCEPA